MLIYSQRLGTFTENDVVVLDSCYSGNGVYRNDPNAEGIAMHGPIPRGTYTFGSLEPAHPHLGIDVIRLIPDQETREQILALGRGPDTFYAHGENPARPNESSDGCIVARHNGRLALGEREGQQFEVTA